MKRAWRTGSPVAGVSGAVLPAAQAAAAGGVALIGVPVAEAAATGGEAPVARQAAVALASVRSGQAGALTRQLVAEGVPRALRVALARCETGQDRRGLSGGGASAPARPPPADSDLCSRWLRSGRWPGRSGRSSSPPRWGDTDTGRRWGRTRC